MFKNCCGCKNAKADGALDGAAGDETYRPEKGGATPVKRPNPEIKVSEPETDAAQQEETPSPEEEVAVEKPQVKVETPEETAPSVEEVVKPEVEKEDEKVTTSQVDEAAEAREPEDDDGGIVRREWDDDDDADLGAAALQAVARGILATPHPSKRGSVPALGTLPQWLSQDDDDPVFEGGGTAEPPATPVGRDELALRRHRFFSDLLQAHQAGTEHRVRFDPLGPTVAGAGPEVGPRTPVTEFESLLTRLEKVTSRLEQAVVCPPDNMSAAAYNDILQGPLATFLGLSATIGGDVAQQATLVQQAFQAQLQYLSYASQAPSPTSQSDAIRLLTPTSTQVAAIQALREKSRTSPHFNHLSAVSESIPALGWVAISPAPAPYVKEMNDAGQFYTNRVLKEWKEKDKKHVEWVKAWVQTLTQLQQFVKQHHTTGLVWGGKAGGAPPPPPPQGMPPPPPLMPDPVSEAELGQDRSALFAEINRGEGITSSLKKVTPDMQTHKNATLRSGPAPFKAPVQTMSSVAPPRTMDKPPVFNRDGKKWLVEYQKGNHALAIDATEMNNVVYVFRCEDSTLTVRGKLNSIVLDSCRKTSLVFDSLVSAVEFVNCQSVQMQVLGMVPTISIDKTDGCQMFLSPDSLGVEIVSSKSSEMNVMIPRPGADYVEHPIPEQYKTTLSGSGLVTVAVESKG